MIIISGQSHHLLLDELESNKKALMLFSVNQDKQFDRVFHILKPDPEKSHFSLGRSHNADVRLHNGFVSRIHAQISYKDEKGFMIEDENSKFGTLILLHGKQELSKVNDISVQVNSSIITVGIKEKHCQMIDSNLISEPPSSRKGTGGDVNSEQPITESFKEKK